MTIGRGRGDQYRGAIAVRRRRTLYFGRRDLEKGQARAWRPLFAIGVDSRFDYFTGVRRLDDLAFLRRVASQLRKAKRRTVAQVIVISHVVIRAMCREPAVRHAGFGP
jgi:hypothetical protein